MSEFKTELAIKLLPCSDKVYELQEDLIYVSDLLHNKICVPRGFQTDLASVPRVPLIYTLWGSRCHREGVAHDYLYRKDAYPQVTRSQADNVFLEAMQCRGKRGGIRYPMFWGVRLFSMPSWHKRKVSEAF